MIFNSIEFLVFFTIVFFSYWNIFKKLKLQNLFILISSYVFYGWWDYRFLFLIIASTLVDYIIGHSIPRQSTLTNKKRLLWTSILFNLGILGFFKYFNFFIESWVDMIGLIGYSFDSKWTLNIILPVGISFYTFQTMSYVIDIYRKELEPTKDYIAFAAFVSFFPQLVAGPIERSKNLLPQILKEREFNYKEAINGVRLIIWGIFKKIIIADSIGPVVDEIFDNYTNFNGGTLWLGIIYFSIQIYCDFSGYSDVAIGTAKLLGINLSKNFNFPFFSKNISEFWKNWHISLTSWFADYLFIPLKFKYRQHGYFVNLLVLIIYFSLIGFWHGSNWTFIFFGLYHCVLFIPSVSNPMFYIKKGKNIENKLISTLIKSSKILITFIFVSIGWVFFRSSTLEDSISYLSKLFTHVIPELHRSHFIYVVLPFMFLEYLVFRFQKPLFSGQNKFSLIIESFLVYYLIYVVLFQNSHKQFIYFQF